MAHGVARSGVRHEADLKKERNCSAGRQNGQTKFLHKSSSSSQEIAKRQELSQDWSKVFGVIFEILNLNNFPCNEKQSVDRALDRCAEGPQFDSRVGRFFSLA